MAKQNNYISMMVNQQGEDWIVSQTPENIQRSCKRILKDMVKGTINYEEYGKYFLDLKFLENLLIGVTNELEINTLNMNACQFYYQYYPQVPNLGAHILHLQKLQNIYMTVLNKLQMVKATGNIGYLADISGLLYSDRNHLN